MAFALGDDSALSVTARNSNQTEIIPNTINSILIRNTLLRKNRVASLVNRIKPEIRFNTKPAKVNLNRLLNDEIGIFLA